ncbi:MAG: EAL domain-containing protein [Lachnospiraceae bacterium]|nr:EAL domain-containing protein [Lachnospiraceae bacterium]
MFTDHAMAKGLVYTNENCVGCNKCINVCSAMGACISTVADEEGRSRINVDPARCVACGACFDACEHDAREYKDDTEAFLKDLACGREISLLIAPSFRANYPEDYERVLGGLKRLGVRRFINVAFGADITTWGYIKYIKEYHFRGGISQPCPAVVTYIEKYLPELLPRLFPVQSPLMCAAIYARKEMGITDRFAFLSPCIAKKLEIDDPENAELVHYNVTFDHLMKAVRERDLYGEPVTDEVEYGLGSIYPMPGGLRDHVRWFLGDSAFIRQIEGERHMYEYFRAHVETIAERKIPFLFIDALNCENGCLCGTATDPELSATDKALFNLLNIREQIKNDRDDSSDRNISLSRTLPPADRLAALNRQFSGLDLSDYLRRYRDLSGDCAVRIPNINELEHIFRSMGKESFESRRINCSSCGYNTCRDMATAIYNGFNHRDNCVHYLKNMVETEHQNLVYKAQHDELLDIFNRRYAMEYLTKGGDIWNNAAYVMADIDSFKSLNATYGHEVADELLKKIATGLKMEALNRRWIIARYSGDQFLIILSEPLSEDHPSLQLIRDIFEEPFVSGNIELKLSVSIGVSNADGVLSAEDHINNAEEAMFAAKRTGRGHTFFYSEKLQEKAREEKRIREILRESFDNDGFFMVYQPKVDVKKLTLCGYEALIRMKQPGVYPGQFIPIAEKNGWIWRIGRITTELVVRQLAAWRDEGHELYPVSINFSSNQISDEGYVGFLEELLQKYDIAPKYVEIEITEGLFLDRTAQAEELFKRFKDMGIRLLMDDFGTGYSSLGYLTYIPVDVVKLDKTLVDNYLVDGKDSFINDVIRLIHDLKREMTVEGVEEKWQYSRLKEFGADTIQGYYFSKPLPAEEAIRFVPSLH